MIDPGQTSSDFVSRSRRPLVVVLLMLLAGLAAAVLAPAAGAYQTGDQITPSNLAEPRTGDVVVNSGGIELYRIRSTTGTKVAAPDGGTSTEIGGSGYSTQWFKPDVGTKALSVRPFPGTGCNVPQTCNRGTMSIIFPHPVTNPRFMISDLGGGESTRFFGGRFNLTTEGVTLSKVAGNANFTVEDKVIRRTRVQRGAACNDGGGCGTVQVNGTVSRVDFNVQLETAGQPGNVGSFEGIRWLVAVDEDFGDAPPGSGNENNDARAVVGDLRLGAGGDNIADNPMSTDNSPRNSGRSPKANANADRDNDNAFDSVQLPAASAGSPYSLTVPISGASKAGIVCGWINFNSDQFFNNPQERACANFDAGATSVNLTWNIPANATPRNTYARFRIGYNNQPADGQNRGVRSPIGAASTGEVEDYRIVISKAAIGLDKVASAISDTNNSGAQDAGDTITYTFRVTNTGGENLNQIAIDDPKVGPVVCVPPPLGLAPGETLDCGPVVYRITQADVDAGAVNNTATVSGTGTSGARVTATDSTKTPIEAAPGIELDKAAGEIVDANNSGRNDDGDTIRYTFRVTNIGNVTLNPVTVDDPKVGPVTCPSGALAPGDFVDCDPVTYTLTQDDVDAGSVNNTAVAKGTPPSGDPVSDDDSTKTPIESDAALDLDKQAGEVNDANDNGIQDAGDTISYTFRVTNLGNVTLSEIRIADPLVQASCPPVPLAPGAFIDCTATYTITQADVNAGKVDNTASASGQPPGGGDRVTSNEDSTSTPLQAAPKIALEKTAGAIADVNDNDLEDAGDTITYTFRVTNTGNVTLDPVTVDDPKVGPVTCPSGPLQPGDSVNCTAEAYKLTQADVDAGKVDNTATAKGTPPSGDPVDATDDVSTPVTPAPAIALEKSSGDIVDRNDNGRQDRGDTLDYSFKVTNTGNVTLDEITVDDPKVGPVNCPDGTLAPGASVTCTASYQLTQEDIDNGRVDNTAKASGAPPNGGDPVTADDDHTKPITPANRIELTKTADPTEGQVGDTITYSFKGRNAGNQALSDVSISDPLEGLSELECTPEAPARLLPGDEINCTATRALTQADVDRGKVDNTATIGGTPPNGQDRITATDDATVTSPANPKIELDKRAGERTEAGAAGPLEDTIAYEFEVKNTGNVTLSDITVDDPKVGAVDCPSGNLAPGESKTCTATYTITQADVDAGKVDNTARSSGAPPSGDRVQSNEDSTSTPLDATRSIGLEKTADPTTGSAAGDEIKYTFVATNTGQVTLSDVSISDPLEGLSALTCDPAQPARLAPGAKLTCTATRSLTQADVDRGSVDNTARTEGTPPGENAQKVSADDDATVTIAPNPKIELDKRAGNRTEAGAAGPLEDRIAYEFEVKNTGNVTLSDITVDDPKVGAVDCPSGSLAPGESKTCTATYTVTQADVDAGKVDNTARSSGQPPSGDRVQSNEDSTSTPLDATRSIGLEKTADPTSGSAAGDEIKYTFVSTNTGQVTLTDVSISDPLEGLSALTCDPAQPARLAPGEKVTCTATRSLTQADVDRGRVDNTARTEGTPPGENAEKVSADDDATVTITPNPKIELDKRAGERTEAGAAGPLEDTIAYEFEVKNTGNVTLSDITVDDPKVGAVDCPSGNLAPGESKTCTATYTVTQADVDAGKVDNTARSSGQPPSGDRVQSNEDSTSTPLEATRSIGLEKTADPTSSSAAGDQITYTFVSTNTGQVTLTDVSITDPLEGLSALTCDPAQPARLAPGERVTCTATRALTQADVDRGRVDNTARTEGTPPGENAEKVGANDDATVTIAPNPSIGLDKSAGALTDANDNGVGDAGDTIEFTFEVTNTGNVTLSDVAVDDPKVGAVECPSGNLAPGASKTCRATYTVTQADVDAGTVDNTATSRGTPPGGGDPVRSAEDSTQTPIEPAPKLALEKRSGAVTDTNDSGREDAGDSLAYTFKLTNTGNVTLTELAVDDPKVGEVTCPDEPLAPGESVECTGSYTLTGGDFDAGKVDNVATAEGTPPTGDPVRSNESETSTPIPTTPQIALDKQGSEVADANGNGRQDAGDTITYRFKVTNTGTVVLNPVTVEDPKVGPVTCPSGALAAGESVDCDPVTYPLTQEDVDAGQVLNTATAIGKPPGDREPVRATDEVRTPVDARPAIELVKSADRQTGKPGDVVTYTFKATNTGALTLSDVAITDALEGVSALTCTPGQPAKLAPGAALTCTATRALTDADAQRGNVENTATVGATPPGGRERMMATAKAKVDVTPTATQPPPPAPTPTPTPEPTAIPGKPRLALTKVADRRRAQTGNAVNYMITVRNTGRSAARRVVVCDLLPRGVTVMRYSRGGKLRGRKLCFKSVRSLAPKATRRYRVRLRIDRDRQAGGLVNVASAVASNVPRQVRGRRTVRVVRRPPPTVEKPVVTG